MPRPSLEDERCEQIMSAFELCVARTGLAKTTLQHVADEADLPRPLVRYFVGNRSEMVDALITRMMTRAEKELSAWPGASADPTFDQLLDVLFEKTFANEQTNRIIDELWLLAERDAAVRARLKSVYDALQSRLSLAMERQGLGVDHEAREGVAFALMSMAYGDASFKTLGTQTNAQALRRLANALVQTLEVSNAMNFPKTSV